MVFGSSTLTTGDLVREVRSHVRGSSRAQVNSLAQPFSSLQTQMVMQFPVAGVQVGQAVEVGLLSYQVTGVNTATQTLDVSAIGEAGDHATGSRVTLRPAFTTHRIVTALNSELYDLSSQGLYRVVSVEADDDGEVAVPEEALTVLDAWWLLPDGTSRPVPESHFQIVDTPSGVELRGPDRNRFSRLEFATFGCRFDSLPLDDDNVNVVSHTGLPSTAVDIPPLGAAAILLAGSEAMRNIPSHQGETRRAGEVPPGALSGAMRNYSMLRHQRVVSEVQRFRQRFGYTKRVRSW